MQRSFDRRVAHQNDEHEVARREQVQCAEHRRGRRGIEEIREKDDNAAPRRQTADPPAL